MNKQDLENILTGMNDTNEQVDTAHQLITAYRERKLSLDQMTPEQLAWFMKYDCITDCFLLPSDQMTQEQKKRASEGDTIIDQKRLEKLYRAKFPFLFDGEK